MYSVVKFVIRHIVSLCGPLLVTEDSFEITRPKFVHGLVVRFEYTSQCEIYIVGAMHSQLHEIYLIKYYL